MSFHNFNTSVPDAGSNLITGPWTLSDLKNQKIGYPPNGLTVFSCFHCGGGSSMGYKLAGFNVLGGVEIDPQMMNLYRENLHPELGFSFLMPIQKFKFLDNIPKELYHLDVLDGSPPCSSFSMAGGREKFWNKKKKFREGQASQTLDDLFFHFIDVAKKLQPKIVVAENVKGLVAGNARGYVKEIFSAFSNAGYNTQLFLLNSSKMGVPQNRERVFFVARKNNLNILPFKLDFDEPLIPLRKAFNDLPQDSVASFLNGSILEKWRTTPAGGYPKTKSGNTFGFIYKAHPNQPCATVTASPRIYHWSTCRRLSRRELIRVQSFPEDYNFLKPGDNYANYVCGMSVPPLMMQRLGVQIAWALRYPPPPGLALSR